MATYTKFQDFVEQLGKGKHVLGTDVLKVMLTNTAPVVTNSVKADLTEIAAGNGYTASGTAVGGVTYTESSGTGTLAGNKVTFTASGGSIGPFRYVVLYNDTQTSPADPLIAFWDYGSSITVASGETFDWKPNSVDTGGTILTIA